MITKCDMMGVLLDACPSFRPTWEAWLAEWAEPADDRPLYLALAEFARHLIGMLERGEAADFPAVFGAVERLQAEGEHYVREAAIVGLLEDLQNLNLHAGGTEPEQFRPFLGPESAAAWDELYVLWHNVGVLKAAGLLEPTPGPTPMVDPTTIQDPELRRVVQHVYRRG
ncbi:hypothetical protein R5W24_003525 [Gemmata sp. JC717]|uniref:DUF7674 family protein n=1 Tax=Gemmata algarum TaxID=2975278 RepID=UPI0021BA5E36|nr:hypothetical protein [Gemmata algarum]MDY3554403.1 hypothetical protein [Gemmata algarum]